MTASVIPDSENIGHLSPLLNEPCMIPLLKKYLNSLPELMKIININYNSGDYESLRFLIHKLHGSAANFGYPCLSELSKKIESCLDEGDRDTKIKKYLDCLTDKINHTIEENIKMIES